MIDWKFVAGAGDDEPPDDDPPDEDPLPHVGAAVAATTKASSRRRLMLSANGRELDASRKAARQIRSPCERARVAAHLDDEPAIVDRDRAAAGTGLPPSAHHRLIVIEVFAEHLPHVGQ